MQTLFADAHVAVIYNPSFFICVFVVMFCPIIFSSSSSHLPFPPSPSLCPFCPRGSEDLEIRGLPQRVCRSSQIKKT